MFSATKYMNCLFIMQCDRLVGYVGSLGSASFYDSLLPESWILSFQVHVKILYRIVSYNITRSQAVARIADRTASQQHYVSTVLRFDNPKIR